MHTMEELRKHYPRGREFVDGSGRICTVVGYRNNKYRGPQLLVNVVYVHWDNTTEMFRSAVNPSVLPEFRGDGF